MPAELEIGHVLFIDVVGYSKLLINEQSEQLRKLKEIVRGTEQVRLADAESKLLRFQLAMVARPFFVTLRKRRFCVHRPVWRCKSLRGQRSMFLRELNRETRNS